jgi:hypothetical protein
MITVTGNAGNSIALRNAVLSVIPRSVVDKVYNTAKQAITGDLSDEQKLIAKRKQVIDGFKDTYNLKEEEILAVIGKSSVSHITADDLVTLIGIGNAIKDGDTTVESAFKTKDAKNVADSSKKAMEAAHEKLDKKKTPAQEDEIKAEDKKDELL